MNKNELKSIRIIRDAFEFESPVEFVLVGTVGLKRAVVAKSKGAQIDLMAYAQRYKYNDDDMINRFNFLSLPFINNFHIYPITVDSPPTDCKNNHEFDNRASEYTLVWRGARSLDYKDKIEYELRMRILDIVDALENESQTQLEWALSPVIDLCNKSTIHSRKKYLGAAYIFWLFLIVYLIVIAGYFFSRFIL